MSKRAASRSPSPPSKLSKPLFRENDASVTCNLPPTCHRHPAVLPDAQAMERHYKTYHTYVCQSEGCLSVFPDERMLELHFAECHDPIVAIRKERGEKTFACFVPTCVRTFATPATRRMHLIDAHHYPKEYFFAVTNKGIGGLLEKWGEGVSLVRPTWKPRTGQKQDMPGEESGEREKTVSDPSSSPPSTISPDQASSSRELHFRTTAADPSVDAPSEPPIRDIDHKLPSTPARPTTQPRITFGSTERKKKRAPSAAPSGVPHTNRQSTDKSSSTLLDGDSAPAGSQPLLQPDVPSLPTPASTSFVPPAVRKSHSKHAVDVDELTSALSAVSLVPRTIRFGRGAAQPGFARRPQGRPAVAKPKGREGPEQM